MYGDSGSLPADGHVSIGISLPNALTANAVFGGFVDIGIPPVSTGTAEFLLFVDRLLVDSKIISYPVQ
jgi:hypothetical protein